MTDTQIIEGESVQIIKAEPMSVGPSQADPIVKGMVVLSEAAPAIAKRNLAICIKLTHASQWMAYGDGNKRMAYCSSGAADRILRWGLGKHFGPKRVEVTRDEEGITAMATASVLNSDGSVYEEFTGIRRVTFERDDKGGVRWVGYIKDEPNLYKSALANLAHTAVSSMMGFRFMSLADWKELGLDLDKLSSVEFRDGSDAPGGPGLKAGFGSMKGKTPTEMDDRNLDYYIGAAEKALKDESKSKWHAREKKWLDALTAEKAQRLGDEKMTTPSPAKSATPKDGEFDYGPPPMDQDRR